MKLEDRFVQTSCGPADGRVRMGSGFLLSDDVVLTARHVLLPPPGDVCGDIAIRSARGEKWLPAELLWPTDPIEITAGPDVALLRVTGAAANSNVLLSPLGLDTSDDGADLTLRVQAVGFPAFKASPRDTHQIEATLPIFSSLRAGALELNDTDHNGGYAGARSAADDWSGYSGAPVLAQRRLIGVVAAVQREGRFDFRATRLDEVLRDPGFVALLPKGTKPVNAVATIETPPVDEFVYLLDRDDQELGFTIAHGACCPAPPQPAATRPLICVLPGVSEARHDPYEFLSRRLARKVLPELKWPSPTIEFQQLPWPRPEGPLAHRLAALRVGLWRRLCGEGPAPGEAEPYGKLMADPSRMRTFYSQIREVPLTPATAELLRGWSTFLAALQVPDNCPPTHLLLVNADYAGVSEWLGGASGSAVIDILSELDLCTAVDLDDWMETRLPAMLRSALKPHRSILQREFVNDFYARDFRTRVSELISARLNV